MAKLPTFPDLSVSVEGHVVTLEIKRPPYNYFDLALVMQLAATIEAIDADQDLRAIVLASEGRAFCSGADLNGRPETGKVGEGGPGAKHLYKEAMRIFRGKKPIVAAVHGSAIGGGLGLALAADFRVTCPEARFSANFARLGLHQGFGISVTLPRAVGQQKAALLLYSGRRITGSEAFDMGLADQLVPQNEVRGAAHALALEFAQSSPLAVVSIRETMRRGLVEAVEAATERELIEQEWQRRTADFAEGIKAWGEKRIPSFSSR